jgi:predicted secreted protein
MRGFVLICGLLVACAAPEDPAPLEPQEAPLTDTRPNPSTGPLAAPVENTATRTITAEMEGQVITVAVGERFAVALVGVPTAGYLWRAETLPPFLVTAGEGGGPTRQEQRQPGFAGGNHWEVAYFTATAPGEGVLTLNQRRPWEAAEPPAQSFTVTIRAQ